MKKPILVCFQGNDGSGKSTQAKKLKVYLENNNQDVSYVWNKFEPRFSKPITIIVAKLFFRKKGVYDNYQEHVEQKKSLIKNRFISKAYKYIWLSDYLSQIFFRIMKSYYIKNDIVILDRYYYDAVVDVATELNLNDMEIQNLLNNISKIFPRPVLTFLLDVPPEISFSRKEDIPSIEYVKGRRDVYLKIGKYLRMDVIDGTKSEKEIHSYIVWCFNEKNNGLGH